MSSGLLSRTAELTRPQDLKLTSSDAMAQDAPLEALQIDPKEVDDNNVEHSEGPEGLTWTPEEERKLVRKVDLLLLPTIWIMYLLSYMDRTK